MREIHSRNSTGHGFGRKAGRLTTAKKQISMLGAFFDDSGTHEGAPLVVIGGLLGNDRQWDAFAAAWEARLKVPLPDKPPITHFHLVPCRQGDGEFSSYSQADRDRLTYLFRRIILDNGMITVAAAVDMIAWNELVPEVMTELLPSPVEMCFSNCIDSVVTWIRANRPGEKVMLFFDQGTKRQLETWSRFYRFQSDRYPEIASVTFAPVPNVVALQGADMIATETYQYGVKWIQDGENTVSNPHFRDYLKRQLSVGRIYGRQQIEEAVQLMNRKVRRPFMP